jgi:hypothetical protein
MRSDVGQRDHRPLRYGVKDEYLADVHSSAPRETHLVTQVSAGRQPRIGHRLVDGTNKLEPNSHISDLKFSLEKSRRRDEVGSYRTCAVAALSRNHRQLYSGLDYRTPKNARRRRCRGRWKLTPSAGLRRAVAEASGS